jgi:hypothetical protein
MNRGDHREAIFRSNKDKYGSVINRKLGCSRECGLIHNFRVWILNDNYKPPPQRY